MKMTIGIGKEREGLNYLEWARELQSKFDCVFQVARETSDKKKGFFYDIVD